MNDFTLIEVPEGLLGERIGPYLVALNSGRVESDRLLRRHRETLLDHLRPFKHGRTDAWTGLLDIASNYGGKGFVDTRRPAQSIGDQRIHSRIRLLRKLLAEDCEKREAAEGILDTPYSDLILELERAHARQTRPHRRTGAVPADCIFQLSQVYCRSTGKRAGSGEASKFSEFVHAFWKAVGHGRELSTVARDIKDARTAKGRDLLELRP